MFPLARLARSPFPTRPRTVRWRAAPDRQRRRSRTRWLTALVLGLAGVIVAGGLAWILSDGELSNLTESVSTGLSFAEPADSDLAPRAAVRVDSSPPGAEVRIDGIRRGRTPLSIALPPGSHAVTLRHQDALDVELSLDVPTDGLSVTVPLWRRRPDSLPLRPVYPGSDLVDARVLPSGQVALTVNLPGQAGTAPPVSDRELWRLEPATGGLARLALTNPTPPHTPVVALAPDGARVAYVVPGSAATSSSLWPTSATAPASSGADSSPSVWVGSVDGTTPAQKVFELPHAAGTGTSDAEQLVDLVWTPDGERLVAMSRSAGNPIRARLFVIDVPWARGAAGPPPAPAELVVLPAEMVPGSAAPDPSGRWLAFLAHTTASSGRDQLTLCAIELRAGGGFRDLADLGTGQRLPAAAPVAWGPAGADTAVTRLAFVAPVPGDSSSGAGLLDLFSALRPSAPPTGLFLADLDAAGLAAAQPRRLGTIAGVAAPVWRDDHTLLGFVRQADGALALRTIDAATGAVRDPGAQLPTGVGQGTGLATHWDSERGRLLLLSHPATSAAPAAGAGSLQAWLVSFTSPSPVNP